MKDDSRELDTCGCCASEEPACSIENASGKESLNYRVKVHSTFFKDMISRLSQPQAPYENGEAKNPLSDLCTRKRNDPAIALLDAWAAAGDVLTFYQERICNEGFIRTAKELRSVLELARTIGYELSPGVSASTSLSFIVDDSPGAAAEAVIPKGTQVESIPGPGELPQVFETVSEITARSAWNELRPRLSRPQPLDPLAAQVCIEGLEDIKAGDYVLFVGVHVFCWEDVPGDDKARLIDFLANNLGIKWAKNANIEKSDKDQTIIVSTEANILHLKLNSNKMEVMLEIDGAISARLMAKNEKKRINVYVYSLNDKIELTAKRVLSAAKDAALNRTFLQLDNPEKVMAAGDINLDAEMAAADFAWEKKGADYTPVNASVKLENGDLNDQNVNRVIGGGNVWRESDLASMMSIQSWDSRSVVEYVKRASSVINKIRDPASRSSSFSRQQSLNIAGADGSAENSASGGISNADLGLFVFKVKSNPFGHNAPRWDSLPDSMRYRTFYGPMPPYPDSWDDEDEPPITEDSKNKEYSDAHFFFERSLPEIVPEDWMLLEGWVKKEAPSDSLKGNIKGHLKGNVMNVRISGTVNDASGSPKATLDAAAQGIIKGNLHGDLEGSVQGLIKTEAGERTTEEETVIERLLNVYRVSGIVERTIADFALTGKATGVTLKNAKGEDGRASLKNFKIRSTNIFAVCQRLELTEILIDDPITKDQGSLELNGFVRNLERGQILVISGEREDLEGVTDCEVVTLSREAEHKNGFTTIYFEPKLKNPYKRETVKINANVAVADHGETTMEVLGSGNGSAVNQEFILKKKPLTYVSAATARGRDAALKIEVDSVSWTQSQSFLKEEDIREKYIIRIDHDQRAHVIFGDGEKGARLPTGVENVAAEYRSGIGKAGMVASDKLTLLKTRPLGIKSVTNPQASSGGEEPEDINQARINARLQVLNVDRIVSLKDFENFALNYPGIGKAQAIILYRGQQKLVHITVATALAAAASEMNGAGEVEVEALATHALNVNSKLFKDLVGAIGQAGDSVETFIVNSYIPCFFNLAAKVQIEEKYKIETISQEIRESLQSAFCFSQRDFSQPASSSEVIGIIQSIEGVAAVKLEKFYRFGESPGNYPILEAGCVQLDGDKIKEAELLLINPKCIELEVKKQ